MNAKIQALLDEWLTGRDAGGAESVRFALDWRSSVTPFGSGRAYSPTVDRLASHLAKELPNARTVNVRFAAGSDGFDDLRIEVERANGQISVDRWRPAKGFENVRGKRNQPNPKRLARARRVDLARARVEDTSEVIAALKERRHQLIDMVEAGAPVADELAAIEAERAAVREVHDRLHLERKIATIVSEVERLEELIGQTPDPELERARESLLDQAQRLEVTRGR